MIEAPAGGRQEVLLQRIAELEARLHDSEETLGAIRRGEIDALVVGGRAEEQQVYTLDSADRPYRVLIEQIQEGAVTLVGDGTILYCNRRLALLLGTAQERVIGQSLRPHVIEEQRAVFDRLLEQGQRMRVRTEITLRIAAGTDVPVLISLSPLDGSDGTTLLCGVLTDLTEQRLRLGELAQANDRLQKEIAERERVEEALRQSQKMEAVGQLTGGLAHDFNNLLTGIAGSLEMLETRVRQGRMADLGRFLGAARDASNRAAALTHRLLAFSRRQTLEPKATSVNELACGMEELIRRTIGPAIELEFVTEPGIWSTLVDQSQLENSLLNLCINARDAMPDGGRLTIETANLSLTDEGAAMRDMAAGDYATFAVTDNGTGMPPDVVARAFDPFYTTKPIGSGTGLGLSMIYGFARQSGGQVRIHSIPDEGTTVRLYLPRHVGAMQAAGPEARAVEPLPPGEETVLVVDDEPSIRMLVTIALEDLGYEVLEAGTGAEGLRILNTGQPVDLLVTDVGLPGGMNGRQLADAARIARPDLKVLFITGYAENAVLSHAHLDPGMHVMTKPFQIEALGRRVRDVIEG